ncbi:acetylxylan esterase [Isosphaeraceae bacterium EP7]
MKKCRRWGTALSCLAFALAGSSGLQAAETPAHSAIFAASDFDRLTDGIALPGPAVYTIKVWTPENRTWKATADGSAVRLSAEAVGEGSSMRWLVAGEASIGGASPAKFRVEGPPSPDPTSSSVPAAALPKVKVEHGPALPALIALSTDPDYNPGPATEILRGRLETDAPASDIRRSVSLTNQLGTDFKVPNSVREWSDRAEAVRDQLRVTLGLLPEPPKTPLKPRVFGRVEREGYTIEKVVLETLPGFLLSGNLYRPAGSTSRRPAILCPHGHGPEGRVGEMTQSRCIRLAKLGAVVFSYDMVGYIDSKPFGHEFSNDHLTRWGLSLATMQTWNSIRALDWISSLDDVDPARIGCTGESGGGTQTFLLTALDQRIKVSAPVVMVSATFQGGCVCENAAGLRHDTDNVEFAALCAPRPLKLVGATGDWTAETMTRAYPTLRQVYKLYGTTDRISADVFDFPHNYNQTSRNAVYPFLGRWLLGNRDAKSTLEGEQSLERPDDLRTFPTDGRTDAGLRSAAEIEAQQTAKLSSQIEALAPADSSERWEAGRALLSRTHRIRAGVVVPRPAELVEKERHQANIGRVSVRHSVIGRGPDEEIPVVMLMPQNPSGRLTVVFDRQGKAGLIDAAGAWNPTVGALLGCGQTVVGFDPIYIGEAFDHASPSRTRPGVVHFNTYNKSLAADRMQDLATVIAWAGSRTDVTEVNLIAGPDVAPLALLALPSMPGLGRTAIDLDGFDFGDGTKPVPAALDLPGVLQFGGLHAAAALAAPAQLRIVRPGKEFNANWPTRAYTLADSRGALRIEAENPGAEALARWIDSGD